MGSTPLGEQMNIQNDPINTLLFEVWCQRWLEPILHCQRQHGGPELDVCGLHDPRRVGGEPGGGVLTARKLAP